MVRRGWVDGVRPGRARGPTGMAVERRRERVRRVQLSASQVLGLLDVGVTELDDGWRGASCRVRSAACIRHALIRTVYDARPRLPTGVPDRRDVSEGAARRLPAPA